MQLLDELGWAYEVFPQLFPHRVSASNEEALEGYLQKVMLDDSLRASDFFAPILEDFREGDDYAFHQQVNLIVARK